MPSAKQIAWRKKFARMSKAGKFRKKKKKGYSPTQKGLMKGIRKIKKKGLTLDERIFLRELKEAREYGTASASDIREIKILERKLK